MDLDAARNGKSTGTGTSEVSWQTVFWALLAIAVNTCLQDCGSILGLDRNLGLLIRSSPCFCLMDSLIIFGQLMYYAIKHPSQSSIRSVASVRKQFRPHDGKQLTLLWLIGKFLLLLGTATQAVKLFALQGLPWTQVCAAAYLLSYVANAVLNQFGKPRSTIRHLEVSAPPEVWPNAVCTELLQYLTGYFQVVLWAAAISPIILSSQTLDRPDTSLSLIYALFIIFGNPITYLTTVPLLLLSLPVLALDALILAAPGCFSYLVIASVVETYFPIVLSLLTDVFDFSVVAVAWLVGLSMMSLSIIIMYQYLGVSLFRLWVDRFSATSEFIQTKASWATMTWYIIATFFLFHIICRGIFIGRIAQRANMDRFGIKTLSSITILYAFCCNIVVMVVYYIHVYQPEGTAQPAWTQNLGRKLVRF
jgi:hypothetical protein